jgi:hypothetical protein
VNALLVSAAALAFGVGVAHSVLGERYILIRLFRRQELPRLFGSDLFTRRTLRFAWHLTTLAWWGFGGQLLVSAFPESGAESLLHVVAATFLATAVVTFGHSRGRHLAWVVFLAIAGLTWAALLSI